MVSHRVPSHLFVLLLVVKIVTVQANSDSLLPPPSLDVLESQTRALNVIREFVQVSQSWLHVVACRAYMHQVSH